MWDRKLNPTWSVFRTQSSNLRQVTYSGDTHLLRHCKLSSVHKDMSVFGELWMPTRRQTMFENFQTFIVEWTSQGICPFCVYDERKHIELIYKHNTSDIILGNTLPHMGLMGMWDGICDDQQYVMCLYSRAAQLTDNVQKQVASEVTYDSRNHAGHTEVYV